MSVCLGRLGKHVIVNLNKMSYLFTYIFRIIHEISYFSHASLENNILEFQATTRHSF